MTIRRISPRRAKTAKLRYNSTFGTKAPAKVVMSIDELKASGLLTSGRKVKTPKQKWKAKADKWFSEFIRLRDSDENGRAMCVTCNNPRPRSWRVLQCGHFVSRRNESTRYDERNCHAQCVGCNKWRNGREYDHSLAIDRKYGPGTSQHLRDKGEQLCRRTESDYRFLAETYKARVDRIKELEPNRYTPTR